MSYGNQISINNKNYWLYGEPLNSYWELIPNKPNLGSLSSSPLDKGYYAKWLLKKNKLYLVDFKGSDIWCKNNYKYDDYFGAKEDVFFAFWFSGILEVQDGKVVFNSHHFGDTKQYRFQMTFENGVLMETKMQELK